MAAESVPIPSALHPPFPGSISRRLGLAFAAFLLLILAIGGLSSFFAWSILSSNHEILKESHHIEITEGIHATIHHLVREVDRAVIERTLDRQSHMKDLTSQAASTIAAFLEEHIKEEEPFAEKEEEITLIRAIERLHHSLDAAANRVIGRVAAKAQPGEEDLSVLDAVAHELPALTQKLNEVHHAQNRRLIARAITRMKVILSAYAAFLLVGGGFLILGILLFSRTVAVPLRRLASATLDIAAGDLGKRVPIGSRDEIGQLSQSFNTMAETLQRREAELRGTQAELSRRVMETQALYRIGVEISSMLELDKVLRSVAEKARTLLQSNGAALCLFRPEGEGLEVRAVSGTVEASRLELEAGRPRCLTEPRGCLCPGSESCSICMTLDGESPGAGLAAPLKRGDDIIGALCVGRKEARAFQPEDRELLEGLAAQAAIAIENAQLYAEVRFLATVQERERIAREMHDGLAQAAGYLHFRLKALEDRMEDGGQPASCAELAEMRMIARKAYEDVRQSIFGLRTAVSKGMGLIPILTEYLHEFSQQSGIPVELQSEDERATRFSPEGEIQLIRVIQEALTNVRKHANAHHAWVRFALDGDMGLVTIADDGTGFLPEILAGDDRRHFGLRTMRERAEGLGGGLEVLSAPGRGTKIVVRIPLAASPRSWVNEKSKTDNGKPIMDG